MSKKIFRDVDTAAERRAALRQTADLGPGEVVLWQGRPKRGLVFTGYDLFLVPFTFVWLWLVSSSGIARSPKMEHGIFILVGGYYAIGRFFVDTLYRSKLRYIVTNQRVIIVNGLPWGGVQSFDVNGLKLHLTEWPHAQGSIHLRIDVTSWNVFNQHALVHACLGRGPILFRIKEARHVFEILRTMSARV